MKLLPSDSQRSRDKRLRRAMMLTTLVPLPIDRACPVLTMPAKGGGDRRPIGRGTDPCPRCATRQDYGCAHFRPSEGDAG